MKENYTQREITMPLLHIEKPPCSFCFSFNRLKFANSKKSSYVHLVQGLANYFQEGPNSRSVGLYAPYSLHGIYSIQVLWEKNSPRLLVSEWAWACPHQQLKKKKNKPKTKQNTGYGPLLALRPQYADLCSSPFSNALAWAIAQAIPSWSWYSSMVLYPHGRIYCLFHSHFLTQQSSKVN